MQLLLVATVVVSATLVAGYSVREFAPGSSEEMIACSTLTPQHGVDRQPPNSDYNLSATRLADGTVKVTLSGKKQFKGFIIQSSGVDGKFDFGSDSIKVGCSQATIRHKSGNDLKTSVSATFKPSQGSSAVVSFKGTVVEDKYNFYELSPVSA